MTEVYIKLKKFFAIKEKNKKILLDDICEEIICDNNILSKIKNIEIYNYDIKDKEKKIINISQIIKILKDKHNKIFVVNIGEKNTILDFECKNKSKNIFLELLKVFVVFMILFSGAMTAIMSFHNDSQLPKVFENYKRVLFKNKSINDNLITIPYSLGLVSGIIFFFYKFNKKEISFIEKQIELEKKDTYDAIVNKFESDSDN
ncbi:MAG: stage V sporulation protein AA [Clostridiales bacterium]|jgi:stage V sporulation protein AA|nr:stage V sporulation protein AA [Clostridiales bacterium]